MAFNIEIAPLAKNDLKENIEFLIFNASKEYAKEIEFAIKDTSRRICKEPKLYQLAKEFRLAKKEIRIAPVKGYLIYYKINEKKELIQIIRIRCDKQDNRDIVFND